MKKIQSFLFRKLHLKREAGEENTGWNLRQQDLYNDGEFNDAMCDIIYSQGILPNNTHGKPLLLDLFYMRPEDVYEKYDEKAIIAFDLLTQQIKRLAQFPGIYNLRSDYAIKLVEAICPDEAWKFRNLPFLLPDLHEIDKEQIIKKHTDCNTLEFLFCGAQANRKGLPIVLEAFKKVKKKTDSHCRLHIVSALSDGYIDIPYDDDIIMHGELSYAQAQTLFTTCQIYVMPSHFESFGLTYLEAMANGMIVIARDYEPQREILDYGRCGILTKTNVDAITSSMLIAINMSVEERIAMSQNAHKRFISHYRFDKVTQLWHQAILDCVAQQKCI
ncbi:MAG: glycosyltransferase family 4 protein [Bacteroidaceae bacterium]|nr:glycosyltransferase family 4 protein [Bacteroidaceae bacterium]